MHKVGESSPRFKAIKDHKKNWNKATKELISRIIAFKRALNGTAESKYSLPASKIGQPMPSEVISFLDALSSNYEAIANEAAKIISEQNDFSRQKSASVKLASSKLSRFWMYLKSPFLSDKNKKLRVSLLSSLASFEDLFKKFESSVMSSGDESIVKSFELFDKINNDFTIIYKTFDSLSQTDAADSNQQISDDIISQAQRTIEDMRYASNIPGAETHRQGTLFDSMAISFKNEKDLTTKKSIAEKMVSTHEHLLQMANELHKQDAKSFEELFQLVKQKKTALMTVADNFLTKWLKKKRHQLSPFDTTSANRLAIDEVSKDTRNIINELMDVLESRLNSQKVKMLLESIMNNIVVIKDRLEPLRHLIRGKMVKPDTDLMMRMIKQPDDDKKMEGLKRKYDALTDRKILDLLGK